MFPWMKKILRGKHFASEEEVKQKMAEALKGIKNQFVQKLFRAVEKHPDRCIASNREYFQDD